jgi:hypothetical protein
MFGEEMYKKLLTTFTRANLNKGKKHKDTKLSVSLKIKASEIPDYAKASITSPLDILIGAYDLDKGSSLQDGVNDWLRLGNIQIDGIEFPEKVLTALKNQDIISVKDALLMTDTFLRECGATNNQIKSFRKSLNRKKGWKPPKSVKKPTKKLIKKKASLKKSSPKKPVKKKSVKKKSTKRKASTKRRTKGG